MKFLSIHIVHINPDVSFIRQLLTETEIDPLVNVNGATG